MSEFFGRLLQNAITKVHVRSALNPVLWFAGLAIPSGIYLASHSASLLLEIAGLALAFVPVTLFVISFVYFMVKDPDKLRSEEYELRKTALTLIEQKGGPLTIEAVSVTAITNPEYPTAPKQLAGPDSHA